MLKPAKFSRLFSIGYFLLGTAMDFPPDKEPIDISDLDELRTLAVPDAEIVGMSEMGNSAQVTIYQ
ncbi:hypothetical protein, partial [Chamaesiphon sp. VAR_48_metabat_135_sub]|uniref:hypothetical protein n=1 Tax=Chamaesiphon sp. VAR_48_metabat_135_sub TaxID=2964699 RepID=UPI00286AE5BB